MRYNSVYKMQRLEKCMSIKAKTFTKFDRDHFYFGNKFVNIQGNFTY